MTPEQIQGYIAVGQLLVTLGLATATEVKAMFGNHPAMTDDALNAILDGVGADAARRAALARADAGEADGGTGTTS